MNEFLNLPDKGAASVELMLAAHLLWIEAAPKAGLDLAGFDPAAPLPARLAWAQQHSLAIGAIYTRSLTMRQGSTKDQIRACVEHAARNQIYVPPEYLCVDEAVKGPRKQRDGLARAESIRNHRHATVLLITALNRLARLAHEAIPIMSEWSVDKGLRGISVTEGIDTNDQHWQLQKALLDMADEIRSRCGPRRRSKTASAGKNSEP